LQGGLQKLKYLIGVVLLLVVSCYAVSFLSFNDKKESLEQKLGTYVKYAFKINGDVRVSLIPTPKVILENVTAKAEDGNALQANKLIVYPSIATILSDNPEINKIVISGADFNLSDIKQSAKKHSDSEKVSLDIPNFELINSSITFDSNVGNEWKIQNINAAFNFSGTISKKLSLVSSFGMEENLYNLNAEFDGIDSKGNTNDATFELTSDWTKLNFQGELRTLFQDPQLMGKIKIAVLQSKEDSLFNIISNLAAADDFSASADVKITDTIINIDNFEINSKSITNAKGELEWLFGFEQELDLSFTIDQVNLDTMMSEKESAFKDLSPLLVLESLIRPLINEFGMDTRSQIFGGASFKIKEIVYNAQKIENLSLNFDLYNGDMVLNYMKFNAPGNTTFSLNGSMTFNDVRPRFDGVTRFKVDDLSKFADWLKISVSDQLISESPKVDLSSKIILIPRSLRFLDLKFLIGKNRILGSASFKDTGSSLMNTKLSLRVNEINTNDFNLGSTIDDLILNMYLNDPDKYGHLFVRYVNDYSWLRRFPIDLSAELLIDKAIYKDRIINKVLTSFRIAPNKLNFDRISINSNLVKMYGSMGVELTALKPNIAVNLTIKQILADEFFRLFPTSDYLYQKLVEQYVKIKTNTAKLSAEEIEKLKVDYNNQPRPFNFLSIHNFNGDFDIQAEGIYNSQTPMTGFAAKGKIYDGVVEFDKLQLNIFNGVLDAKGNLVIVSTIPNLNFSYAINNFSPKAALWYLFGMNNLDGYMSANGQISGAGYNIPALLASLVGNMNFVGKKVTFVGMDLGEVIRVTELNEALNIRIEKLKYFGSNGDTVFDDVDGKIAIKSGNASITDVNLSTNRSRGRYVAEVDYVNNLINSKGKISFIPIGTASSLNIDIDSKGKISAQNTTTNLDDVVKYLQLRLGSSEALQQQEEKARSLLRNRRL
jgi:uncharacterized protein involved in outer membrane biogenesis